MDQVKQVLAVLQVHKFWVACGFLTLLPVGIWFMAKSALDKEAEARKSAITSAYSTAQSIVGIVNHPNPISAAGMDANIAKLKKSVFDAWQAQYEEQKQILVWPSELRSDFVAKVDPLRPIEERTTYPMPANEELRREYREEYRDYIKEELPKLAKIIGAPWGSEASSGDGYGGGMGVGMPGAAGGSSGMRPNVAKEDRTIVQWDTGDQSRLMSQFDWSHTQDKLPETLDILYAQEDLWILNAVMNIIKRTNRDATASYDATIKELKYIQLGKAVRGAVGSTTRLTGSAGGGAGGEMDGGMYGEGGGGGEDMYGAMGGGEDMYGSMGGGLGSDGMDGGTTGSTSRDPADMRYVDNNYAPLDASRVRSALSPDGKSPEDAFLVVAKRVPIRLGLTMDQRRIHRLVTECGNSTLMVEVRQVRINKQSSVTGGGGASGFGGGGAGGFGGGGGGEGMYGGGGFGGGGFGGGGFGGGGGDEEMGADDGGYGNSMSGATAAAAMKSSYDLPVELYGIIYIYNPVAEKKLGIELKEADPNATPLDTAPVEAAAGAPAAVDQAQNEIPNTNIFAVN